MQKQTLLLSFPEETAPDFEDINKSNQEVQVETYRKSSIDGGVVEIIVSIIAAKHLFEFIKEIVLEKMRNRKATSIKLGDLSAQNADAQTIAKIFELYEEQFKDQPPDDKDD